MKVHPGKQILLNTHGVDSYYPSDDKFMDSGAKDKHFFEDSTEKAYTLEELKDIEKTRRDLVMRIDLPAWRMLLCWTGTCLTQLNTDPLIWCTMTIFVCIRTYAYCIDYVPYFVEELSQDNQLNILGGFLSFFLVLFVNQTNGRFLQMYGFSKACTGRIQDIAGLAHSQLPPEMAEKLVKHINAAHVAGYVGLKSLGHGSPYTKDTFFDIFNKEYNLLTLEEMKSMQHIDMEKSGKFMKKLVTQCQVDVSRAKKQGYIDGFQANEMHSCIMKFRSSMDGIYDFTNQTPHFFYIHFMVLLSAIYLPLFAVDTAISAGWGEEKQIGLDIMDFTIVFLQCIFVVGLRALGVNMIDPYGVDLEDLSVVGYVEGTLKVCELVMNDEILDG